MCIRDSRIVWEKKEITHRDLIGSPGYVKRVMMNILSNALKYNRENGQIYISCIEIPSEQPEMTTMEFVCRDTGIGMAEEFQKHIFEPFAQEHACLLYTSVLTNASRSASPRAFIFSGVVILARFIQVNFPSLSVRP